MITDYTSGPGLTPADERNLIGISSRRSSALGKPASSGTSRPANNSASIAIRQLRTLPSAMFQKISFALQSEETCSPVPSAAYCCRVSAKSGPVRKRQDRFDCRGRYSFRRVPPTCGNVPALKPQTKSPWKCRSKSVAARQRLCERTFRRFQSAEPSPPVNRAWSSPSSGAAMVVAASVVLSLRTDTPTVDSLWSYMPCHPRRGGREWTRFRGYASAVPCNLR